ncbi:MAG: VWA domain-containing protein [Candidatus Coproplasma sp.]
MSSINLDNPWLLFIALPLIVLIIVPFAIAIRKDNLNGHNLASGIIHIVMAIIIAFAAAGTSVITTVTQTDVYVLADVSYSSSLNLDTVDRYINQLELPPNSRKGVVCFANGHKLVTRLGERFTTVKDSGVDPSSTNIVDALSYTGSLFRDDVIKRIVLITDGKATDGSGDDALKHQINSLAERNIHVDAIFVDNNMLGDTVEVQMSDAEFTPSVSLNRDEVVRLTIQANCPEGQTVDASVSLYKDDEKMEIFQTLEKGENTVTFTLDTSTTGAHDYTAKVECEGDFNANNNEISFTQTVSGNTSILLIANSLDDYDKVNEIYADRIADGSATVDARIGMTDFEEITIEKLCQYDEIILSDYDVTTLESSELFLKNLDTAVSLYGKSLITFGDLQIQYKTDGELDALSNMLPVTYGKTGSAAKLYTLLIDTSRSMEMGSKLTKAKTAAKEIVKLLAPGDKLNIIEFNGDASPVLINHTIANDKTEALAKIDNLKIVQGTVMSAGLQLAHDRMTGGSYSEKRLILISDGIDMGGQDVLSEIRAMRADSINTMVLDVGRTATDNNQAAAEQLLADIASVGNSSQPYDISDADNLEQVIKGELAQEDLGAIGSLSFISVNRNRDEVLSGISASDINNYDVFVSGFVKSQAKANANTVLNVSYSYTTGSGDDGYTDVYVPLYAYWQYGNGKVASFTSALSGSWVEYVPEELKARLYNNILDTCIPSEKTNYPFLFDVEKGAGSASVSITPSNLRDDGWAKYKITAPDGSVSEGDMSFGSLGYGYDFVTPSEGKYTVAVTYGYGDYSVEAVKYVNVAYSAEYDSFAIYDASALIRGVGANGKVSTDGTLKLENDDKEVGKYNLSLTLPLLIVCVALYAVDIAVRKLKWEDIKSLFGRGKQ